MQISLGKKGPQGDGDHLHVTGVVLVNEHPAERGHGGGGKAGHPAAFKCLSLSFSCVCGDQGGMVGWWVWTTVHSLFQTHSLSRTFPRESHAG